MNKTICFTIGLLLTLAMNVSASEPPPTKAGQPQQPQKTVAGIERQKIEDALRREMKQLQEAISCGRCQGRGYLKIRRKRTINVLHKGRVLPTVTRGGRQEEDPLVKICPACAGFGFDLDPGQERLFERVQAHRREHSDTLSDSLGKELDTLFHQLRVRNDLVPIFRQLTPTRQSSWDRAHRVRGRRSQVEWWHLHWRELSEAVLKIVPGPQVTLAEARRRFQRNAKANVLEDIMRRTSLGGQRVGTADFTFSELMSESIE